MIIDLGLIDYEEAYEKQKRLVQKRIAGEIGDSALLAEHRAVYTIGRLGRMENLLEDAEELRARGVKVLRVNRGGDITFHGPGQLVIYPIIDLKNRGRDIHRYLRDLEEIAIRCLREYAVFSDRSAGRTGVWVGDRKIASVGVGVANWVTFHGLSLNVDCDLGFFKAIFPCGLRNAVMTSLAAVLNRPVSVEEVKDKIVPYARNIFGISEVENASREQKACLA